MTPETRRLDSEEKYRAARRALLKMGFHEQGAAYAPGHMSCVLIAPDGYATRLVYDAKASDPS